MFRYRIDYSELKGKIKNFDSIKEIDVIKEVNWYLNQVYRDLSKKHGKKYTYVTPPSTERSNLRVRSRRLLNYLRDSRFTRTTRNQVIAGWDIPEGNPKGNYLGIHVGDRATDAAYTLIPTKAKYTYTTKKGDKRILIPLRAGMTADGKPKPISGRHASKLKTIPFEMAKESKGFDWSGERKSKFHAKTIVIFKVSGRKKIPMYIIVKQARIPKRLLLGPVMEKYKESFYERVETQIEQELSKLGK